MLFQCDYTSLQRYFTKKMWEIASFFAEFIPTFVFTEQKVFKAIHIWGLYWCMLKKSFYFFLAQIHSLWYFLMLKMAISSRPEGNCITIKFASFKSLIICLKFRTFCHWYTASPCEGWRLCLHDPESWYGLFIICSFFLFPTNLELSLTD